MVLYLAKFLDSIAKVLLYNN